MIGYGFWLLLALLCAAAFIGGAAHEDVTAELRRWWAWRQYRAKR